LSRYPYEAAGTIESVGDDAVPVIPHVEDLPLIAAVSSEALERFNQLYFRVMADLAVIFLVNAAAARSLSRPRGRTRR
jgi:hypothetical protein